LLIAAAVIGIMVPIGSLTGSSVSVDKALERLKEHGGERTLGLVGPGSKQRYLDAKIVVDYLKQPGGLPEEERIKLAEKLTGILSTPASAEDGDVRNLLMLALGRVWQKDATQGEMNSEAAVRSRQTALKTILTHIDAKDLEKRSPAELARLSEDEKHELKSREEAMRKAAVLSLAFWAGREEVSAAIPKLVQVLEDGSEALDVRIAAATALGPVARPDDTAAVEALNKARGEADDKNRELVWAAVLSLAQLDRPEAEGGMLMLLSRNELAKVIIYDQSTDWKNPVYRKLSEGEQQRILINAMLGARKLHLPSIKTKLQQIAQSDPSSRVRWQAAEILKGNVIVEE
jgi:hypothetical protein